MLNKIKNNIETHLKKYAANIDRTFALRGISPLLSQSIKEFILRKGKRIRPILFVIGYLGFAKKAAKNLYTGALSLELLHNFMLIHDDIIDNSKLRRGRPAMHIMLENAIKSNKKRRFDGKDLAIVLGDVLYAMGIKTFLAIKESPLRKAKAMEKFAESTIKTGGGEFAELLFGFKDISQIKKEQIYKIYDLKTSDYTFSAPLAMGAVLAGANTAEVNKLIKYGIYMGRAFQINDDMLDLFGEESEIGKSSLTDLKESKKTLVLWYAYRKTSQKNKKYIQGILSKDNPNIRDLKRIRKIIKTCGAVEFIKKESDQLLSNGKKIAASLKMRPEYKNLLLNFSEKFQ
jgi:geranylgeranyl diphosphate synthase type I